jgi:excisionase family DNA binding protein
MDPDRYLTIKEAAELLQVHHQTVRNWLRQGRLPGVQIGRLWRISAAAVDELIRSGQAPQVTQR